MARDWRKGIQPTFFTGRSVYAIERTLASTGPMARTDAHRQVDDATADARLLNAKGLERL